MELHGTDHCVGLGKPHQSFPAAQTLAMGRGRRPGCGETLAVPLNLEAA